MIDFAIFIVLIVLGYGFGQYNEQKHYRSIKKREEELSQLPAVASKHLPVDNHYAQHLIAGNVVVSSDYFKSFMATLVNILGGRVRAFEPLLDRGRREALLRLKEQAMKYNATMVLNVKYETSRIGGGITTVEVLAYGTALTPAGPRQP